jgi:serine/threonine protein kinase
MGKDYDMNVDMWSIGCIVFYMLFGCTAFQPVPDYIKHFKDICLPYFSIDKTLKNFPKIK